MQEQSLTLKLPGINLKYFRINGIGLGNILIAWSHAYVFAKLHNISIAWPIIPQLRLRYFLGVKGTRSYLRYFKTSNDYIQSVPKSVAVKILDFSELPEYGYKAPENICVTCESFYDSTLARKSFNRFEYLVKHETLVKEHIMSVLNKKTRCILNSSKSNSIAVHIRLGDFTKHDSIGNSRNQTNPVSWYIDKAERIRDVAGSIPIILFSDDWLSPEIKEFRDSLQNIHLPANSRDIDQLAEMSKSKYLIASNSTFSQWASFLGDSHTVYDPNKRWDLPADTFL